MKVYVVGRGAVGSFLGDRLASIGVEVAYAPRAIDAVTPYDADVAIVATKAYDTDGAITTLRKAIAFPEKCVFVSPQNGVGNEEKLAEAFGANNVVAAALTVPVDLDRDGHVRAAKEGGGLAFAPVGESAYNWLVATFASRGLRVSVVEQACTQRRRQCELRDSQRPAGPHGALRKHLHAGDSHDSRGERGDGGDEAAADRFAAVSRARVNRFRCLAEPARARRDGAANRRRSRQQTALTLARSTCRQDT
jgi:hypothetical protein